MIAHALTDALLGAAGLADIGALFPSDDDALPRRRLPRPAGRGLPAGARGRVLARQRRLRADRPGAADRAVSEGDERSARERARSERRPGRRSRHDDRLARFHGTARGARSTGRCLLGATRRRRVYTFDERPSSASAGAFSSLPARCARSRSTLRRASGPRRAQCPDAPLDRPTFRGECRAHRTRAGSGKAHAVRRCAARRGRPARGRSTASRSRSSRMRHRRRRRAAA